ncbi:hypothetical protein [Xanthobacter autotrophicus]|uniref:hypothetical protein n=1 Tax=Xanthobacter autotrophicus TaxID=280 RepID=UPI00372CD30F
MGPPVKPEGDEGEMVRGAGKCPPPPPSGPSPTAVVSARLSPEEDVLVQDVMVTRLQRRRQDTARQIARALLPA